MDKVRPAIAARQARRAAAEAVGIDAPFIALLVDRFYARIRADAVLGPIFNARISDWPAHLKQMKHFWASVLHASGSFSGNPMQKHIAIPGIEEAEFRRWLRLFDETLTAIAPSEEASQIVAARARQIADSLLTGIRLHRDGRTDLEAMRGLS
jgi:hemoglobin